MRRYENRYGNRHETIHGSNPPHVHVTTPSLVPDGVILLAFCDSLLSAPSPFSMMKSSFLASHLFSRLPSTSLLLLYPDAPRFFCSSSGGGAFPASGNNAPDWADMTDTYQAQAMKTRLQIPMIYGVDAVHGHNNVYGATIFPHHVGLGATRNTELVKKVAAAASVVWTTCIRYIASDIIASNSS